MYAGDCIRRSSTGIVFVFTGFLLITCCGYNILTFLQPNARTCDHNLSTFWKKTVTNGRWMVLVLLWSLWNFINLSYSLVTLQVWNFRVFFFRWFNASPKRGLKDWSRWRAAFRQMFTVLLSLFQKFRNQGVKMMHRCVFYHCPVLMVLLWSLWNILKMVWCNNNLPLYWSTKKVSLWWSTGMAQLFACLVAKISPKKTARYQASYLSFCLVCVIACIFFSVIFLRF